MVRLTVDYIVKNNGNTKLKRDETTEQYLKRITHLYMSERNIDEIDNLSQCKNLTVFYLYDNKLKRTINLGTAQNLTHLYLQNNNITKIEGLVHLQKLSKLYLGYNNLLVIEGLQNLELLKELHVEHQKLPAGEKLLFEPRTLQNLSQSLEILNVSGNNLDSLNCLSSLQHLIDVQARCNNLKKFEDIQDAVSSWKVLLSLDLSENPVAASHKYRDRIIVISNSLDSLDGKEISETERQFLIRWKASRDAKRKELRSRRRTHDLPPLHRNHLQMRSAFLNPTSQYIMKGLPGGRKRFDAILAKSRSLPNSAVNRLDEFDLKSAEDFSKINPVLDDALQLNNHFEYKPSFIEEQKIKKKQGLEDEGRSYCRLVTPFPATNRPVHFTGSKLSQLHLNRVPVTSPRLKPSNDTDMTSLGNFTTNNSLVELESKKYPNLRKNRQTQSRSHLPEGADVFSKMEDCDRAQLIEEKITNGVS